MTMQFRRVTLKAAPDRMPMLRDFYAAQLGLPSVPTDRFVLGASELRFEPGEGEPFYHFALLVPGDRFQAAFEWAGRRVELLARGKSDEFVFDFADWDACACYFHDPAGNIVELIAHRGVEENHRVGEFAGSELLGFSELGLVGDPPEIARALDPLEIRLWDGELGPQRLAFLGERARTLIVVPEPRGWLPTARPAEHHPVDVLLDGPPNGEVAVCGHRVARR
jgi:catechol 2,3-dioxygenase-like lactoylglutathione lyase family enzyme